MLCVIVLIFIQKTLDESEGWAFGGSAKRLDQNFAE